MKKKKGIRILNVVLCNNYYYYLCVLDIERYENSGWYVFGLY